MWSTGLGKAYSHIEVFVTVKVEGAKSGEENEASVSGGGAPSASVQRPIVVSGEATPFGVEQYELRPENADGSPDTQAGSHPFQLTSVIALNQAAEARRPPAAVKDLHFKLPAGSGRRPGAVPAVPAGEVHESDVGGGQNVCPDDTAGRGRVGEHLVPGERRSARDGRRAAVQPDTGVWRAGAVRVRRPRRARVSRYRRCGPARTMGSR